MGFIVESWPPAVLASMAAAVVATIGMAAVVWRYDWATRNQVYFTAFAAGVLVTTAFFMFPVAFEVSPNAPFLALLGYLVLYGINMVFRVGAGAVIAPFVAIGLHSFIDGFEYAVLFDHDLWIGLVASVGLIAHEFAEGVILFAVLRTGGATRGNALLLAFLGAAVTTPAGALVSQEVLHAADSELVGGLLAAASGALLYVGATHLPTHFQGAVRGGTWAVYLLGVLVAVGLSLTHMGGPGHAAH